MDWYVYKFVLGQLFLVVEFVYESGDVHRQIVL